MRQVEVCFFHERRLACIIEGERITCEECELPPLEKGQGIEIIPVKIPCPECSGIEDQRRKECPVFHPTEK